MKTIYKVEYKKTEDKTRAYDEYFSSLKKAKKRVEFTAWVRGVEVIYDNICDSIIRVVHKKDAEIADDTMAYPKWITRIELN